MITLFHAFIGQVEILMFGSTLFLLRHYLGGDKKSIGESFPDTFQNKYFILYLVVLWFGVLTWLTWYLQSPRYGVWSVLFAYNPLLAWSVLGLVTISNVTMLLMDRRYNKI